MAIQNRKNENEITTRVDIAKETFSDKLKFV